MPTPMTLTNCAVCGAEFQSRTSKLCRDCYMKQYDLEHKRKVEKRFCGCGKPIHSGSESGLCHACSFKKNPTKPVKVVKVVTDCSSRDCVCPTCASMREKEKPKIIFEPEACYERYPKFNEKELF